MAKKRSGTGIQRSRAVSSSEKATFHHVTGAGRRHVRRPFFDLNESDMRTLTTHYDRGLEKLLDRNR